MFRVNKGQSKTYFKEKMQLKVWQLCKKKMSSYNLIQKVSN